LRAEPGPCPALLALPPKVFEALAKLVLNAEIFRPLCRRHERRELALLAFRDVQPSSLNRQKLVQQPGDPLLIRRIACQNFSTQSLTSAPLIPKQLHPVPLESIVDPTELLHLRVIEVETSFHDLGESLAKLPLERARLLARRARL